MPILFEVAQGRVSLEPAGMVQGSCVTGNIAAIAGQDDHRVVPLQTSQEVNHCKSKENQHCQPVPAIDAGGCKSVAILDAVPAQLAQVGYREMVAVHRQAVQVPSTPGGELPIGRAE